MLLSEIMHDAVVCAVMHDAVVCAVMHDMLVCAVMHDVLVCAVMHDVLVCAVPTFDYFATSPSSILASSGTLTPVPMTALAPIHARSPTCVSDLTTEFV